MGNPRCSTCKGKTSFVAIAGRKVDIVVNLLETTTQFVEGIKLTEGKERFMLKRAIASASSTAVITV